VPLITVAAWSKDQASGQQRQQRLAGGRRFGAEHALPVRECPTEALQCLGCIEHRPVCDALGRGPLGADQPILKRILRASGALHSGALERLVHPSPRWSRSERQNFDRENLEDMRVMVCVGPQLLEHLARDLTELAGIIGAADAPVKNRTPPTAEALDWLRRQLDGLEP
jgi:hypothetical protein